MLRKKYIKVSCKAWEDIRRAMVEALKNNAELKAYRNTDMSPDEILLASERQAAFEEIGMEPSDLMDLVRRDTAKEATVFGENLLCPSCGNFHAASREYAESFPFCDKCGQRIIPPASVTKEVL
ncbi:MAG: hypothetical protein IJX50_00135 [Clostridia bacterium]|nr:hypothetical protein [Clostridia bacterium]